MNNIINLIEYCVNAKYKPANTNKLAIIKIKANRYLERINYSY